MTVGKLGMLAMLVTAGNRDVQAQAPAPEAPLKQRLREIRDEPSDQVKTVPVQDLGTRIPVPPPVQGQGQERRLPAPEPREERPATLPELSGVQKRALFATPGYQERFEELIRCRDEVAMARKARPADVAARGVQLRWMVGADGDVQGVQVVAAGSVDPDVLGCVHRKVSSWRISPPPNMPYRATHRLRFSRP